MTENTEYPESYSIINSITCKLMKASDAAVLMTDKTCIKKNPCNSI